MNQSHASSVPPIFAMAHNDPQKPSAPPRPRNPDETSKAPKRPEDTSPSGDALNGTGEDNQHKKGK
jgi:hypothetical protein